MHLHEYQAKQRFSEFGIPTPNGQLASTPEKVYELAKNLDTRVIIKPQIFSHNFVIVYPVRRADTPELARDYAEEMLGTTVDNITLSSVLVEPYIEIVQEIYLAITINRTIGVPILHLMLDHNPETVIHEAIDPILGLHTYQINDVASRLNIDRENWRDFVEIVKGLYRCFVQSDAERIEINPLGVTLSGQLIALSAAMSIDDNALYRQAELAGIRDSSGEPVLETQARQLDVHYVKLSGQVGCVVNGAGLTMAIMDLISYQGAGYGIFPANFLDIGGGAGVDKITRSLELVLSDPDVQVILMNIFGGITRCDDVAKAIITLVNQVELNTQIIVRFQGLKAQAGLELLQSESLPQVTVAQTLTEAVKLAVRVVREKV